MKEAAPNAGRRGIVLLAVALLAGCGGGGASPTPGATGTTASPALSPSSAGPAGASPTESAAGSPEPTVGEGEFLNPVIEGNMPDPYILDTGERYYLYSTTDEIHHYPYATSDDLVTWERQKDAMPIAPAWSNGNYWAPEVIETPAGFVMYFTARTAGVKQPNRPNDAQCVGVAVAQGPDGPFVDDGDEPLVCQPELGGTIDASVVRDVDDTLWLIYKNDGNCCGMATRFFMRPMAEDGLSFAGDEIEVEGVRNDEPWEGSVVEAPTIWHEDGTYYLFYSANAYDSVRYAVGYATSDTLTGPYVDAEENPILKTKEGPSGPFGPGHQTLIEDRDGDLWMVYHAWDQSFLGRQVWIDELVFEGGKPIVKGPDVGPQPKP
jgi:beta-xylosidase